MQVDVVLGALCPGVVGEKQTSVYCPTRMACMRRDKVVVGMSGPHHLAGAVGMGLESRLLNCRAQRLPVRHQNHITISEYSHRRKGN